MNPVKTASSLFFLVFYLMCFSSETYAQMPPVVSRADWGAREPTAEISTYKQYGLEKPKYTKVILHSTAMGNGSGPSEAKKIQDYEMDHLNFADMAYNFLIDTNGIIYEGRQLWYIPASAGQSEVANLEKNITLDPDWGAIGVGFSSDPKLPLNMKQILAANNLIQFFIQRYGVNEVITHAEVKQQLIDKNLKPIGDYDPHVCPGDGAMESLIDLRQSLKLWWKIPFDEAAFRKIFAAPINPDSQHDY